MVCSQHVLSSVLVATLLLPLFIRIVCNNIQPYNHAK